MAYKRKTYKKRAYSKKRTYKRKSYSTVKRVSPLKKMVKMEIARATETKQRSLANLNQPLYASNSASFDANNVIALGCQSGGMELAQGTGQGQRVGNKVKVRKATFKGSIVALPYNATSNLIPVPTQIKMFLMYDKENPNAYPAPATSADFLDLNNSTQGFHNDLVDLWAPVNTERYHIFKTKIFKVGYSTTLQQSTGTLGTQNYANNDFKYNVNFSIDYTKYMVKTQVFRDNNLDSTSRQVYALFVPVAASGGAFTATTIPVAMQSQITLEYEDA